VNFFCQRKNCLTGLMVLFFAIGLPVHANAHLVTTGLGPVYDGMEHMLLSPEQWIMIAGLAFLAGLNGPATGRVVLFSFPCAWLAGGCAGHFIRHPLPPLVPALTLLIVGGLLAADLKVLRNFMVIIAVVLGLLQGYLNGVSFGATNTITLILIGASIVAFVIVALGAGLVVGVHGWRRIVVRVAGSWMAAIGILLAGWMIRKP
jgi:hydrogenase/urease accessory protein HupE